MVSVLSIAGSDSGGGAGVQQDLKVFSSFKLHGASVLTAITAQNTVGVQDVFSLPSGIVGSQLDSVFSDLKPAAVKTGMLSSAETIRLVDRKISEYSVENLVVDPVMVSTSGDRLLDEDALDAMKKLISKAKISTPNIEEARILTGMKIDSLEDMEAAAEKLGSCVVKGGHLNGVDVLAFKGDFYRYEPKKLYDVRLHGAGCAFSAAIASNLALGSCLPEAVSNSKAYMDSAISRNYSPGGGLKVIDSAGIRLSLSYKDPGEDAACDELADALRLFSSSSCAYGLIPEVGVNLAYALPGAKTIDAVAGISGRLVRDRFDKKVVCVGFVMFAGTSHVGRIALTAMSSDPDVRAAMNLRFSREAVEACRDLGLSVASFDRQKQPEDTSTMEWGTSEAIDRMGRVPDVIYDLGAVGKEPMIRVLGRNPEDVIDKALRIGGRL